MRIERAIDEYLAWRELERDSTKRTIDSYRRILDKLADAYPEATWRHSAAVLGPSGYATFSERGRKKA